MRFSWNRHFINKKSQQRVSKLVDSWISEIMADFDHILILEALDTSLAVMMIKFCWSIDDVVHLRVCIEIGFYNSIVNGLSRDCVEIVGILPTMKKLS